MTISSQNSVQKWLLVFCLLLISMAVGFHYGQRFPVYQTIEAAHIRDKSDGQIDYQVLAADSQPQTHGPVKPLQLDSTVTVQPAISTKVGKSAISVDLESIAANDDRDHLVEIEYLSSTASRLRERVAALEWETLTLESDLLDKEVALEKALGELDSNIRQRKHVYNITNVPIGGFVAPAPTADNSAIQQSRQAAMLKQAEIARQAEITRQTEVAQQAEMSQQTEASKAAPADTAYMQERIHLEQGNLARQQESQQGAYSNPASDSMAADNTIRRSQYSEPPPLAPSVTAYREERQQQDANQLQGAFQQRSFDGPSEDRYEDYVNPSYAETPHQAQNNSN